MDLPVPDIIPNDAIDNISTEVVHTQHFMGAEHRLLVGCLGHMLLHGLHSLVSLTSIHEDLHVHKFVIRVKQLVFLVEEKV